MRKASFLAVQKLHSAYLSKQIQLRPPTHTVFEVIDRCKSILLGCICRDNRVFHRKVSSTIFKFRRTVWVIDWRLRIRIFCWIIPFDFMVVGNCVFVRSVVVRVMTFCLCLASTSNLGVNTITILISCLYFTRTSDVAAIFRFVWIWTPLSTISATAALVSAADQVWLYCITFGTICLANFENVKVFLLARSFNLVIKNGVSRRILRWSECNDRIWRNPVKSTVCKQQARCFYPKLCEK